MQGVVVVGFRKLLVKRSARSVLFSIGHARGPRHRPTQLQPSVVEHPPHRQPE